MSKTIIKTDQAPAALGTYSQATRHGDLVFLSGQVALDPATMELVNDSIEEEIHQVFRNLRAVCQAAGSDLDSILKLSVFLTDMNDFPVLNAIMAEYFSKPYPARAAIGVAALPKAARVEMEAILGL
jgi:reactive intermediate/imine deaminase